jgi:catechol 2,3-dioxygenase-like lactoylglutathione lyase family enzyme
MIDRQPVPTGRIAWTHAEIEAHERSPRPHFIDLAHVSVPVRDLDEARRFYTEVLGGRLILNIPGDFVEVIIGTTIFGMSAKNGRAPAPGAEFPHVALSIASDQFLPMKRWLEDHGVTTHELWTRNRTEALMYFKDPSGNLFEIYCTNYAGAKEIRVARGPEEFTDLADLNYNWRPR